MAAPISKAQGFVRTPDKYPHDAFGADTGGRVRPHSGLDTTPTVKGAHARAVLAGTVTRAGATVPAGNFVEILGDDGWLWLTIHLASRNVRAGDTVAEVAVIGVVGNTGGAGALGKSTMAVHSHVSRCRNRAAADRVLNGLIRARIKGETRQQWADAHGLSDPWPTIRDGKTSNDTPATSGPDEEDDMSSAEAEHISAQINALGDRLFGKDGEAGLLTIKGQPYGRVERIQSILEAVDARTKTLQGQGDAVLELLRVPATGGRGYPEHIANTLVEVLKAVRDVGSVQGVAIDVDAIVNEMGERLQRDAD